MEGFNLNISKTFRVVNGREIYVLPGVPNSWVTSAVQTCISAFHVSHPNTNLTSLKIRMLVFEMVKDSYFEHFSKNCADSEMVCELKEILFEDRKRIVEWLAGGVDNENFRTDHANILAFLPNKA